MTNKQAIDILNAVKFIIEDYTDEMEEAFDMAISALKAQQAAGDTISRQEAIAATRNAKISFTIKSDIDFANYRKEIQEMFNNILDAQEKALKGLPPAQPQQKPEWAQKIEEYRKSAPSFVRNPLVWALYQTWKEYDERLFNHSRAERRTDGRSGQETGCD